MAGSEDLRLPDELREGVLRHLATLREGYEKRSWGGRVGFGERPVVIVIDLAKAWTDPKALIGSDLDDVVHNTRRVLDVAREGDVPIFFTVMAYGPDDPRGPWDLKKPGRRARAVGTEAAELDPRLGRRPGEKLIVKKYGSSFKGTDLHDMLSGLRVDTLIVTGCSTSHCVHSTCKDAASGFRVIVPKETVGDRCELFHLVALLDIDLSIGDVVGVEDVLGYLERVGSTRHTAQPL